MRELSEIEHREPSSEQGSHEQDEPVVSLPGRGPECDGDEDRQDDEWRRFKVDPEDAFACLRHPGLLAVLGLFGGIVAPSRSDVPKRKFSLSVSLAMLI
ncbi:MAG: hypothetical protein ABMA25_03325 [Ilumatobacteraceae bacterium]